MRLRRTALLALALVSLLSASQALAAAPPRTSLTAVENDLMCVICHEPLAVAQAPEAEAERHLISQLIARGYTKSQIDRAMVVQYGTAVLAKPPARGFDLSVYVIPPAAVLLGLAVVGFALARWRRSGKDSPPERAIAPLSEPEAQRLEEDLARFRG
jgi:cytochrome c-type biogenesis protein CcmH